MATSDTVRTERERREAVAIKRAAALPPGDYYASGVYCIERKTRREVECETHIDAVMLMLAAPKA